MHAGLKFRTWFRAVFSQKMVILELSMTMEPHRESGLTWGGLRPGCQTGQISCRTAEFTIRSSFHGVSFFPFLPTVQCWFFNKSANFIILTILQLWYTLGVDLTSIVPENRQFSHFVAELEKMVEKMSAGVVRILTGILITPQNMSWNHFLPLNCSL